MSIFSSLILWFSLPAAIIVSLVESRIGYDQYRNALLKRVKEGVIFLLTVNAVVTGFYLFKEEANYYRIFWFSIIPFTLWIRIIRKSKPLSSAFLIVVAGLINPIFTSRLFNFQEVAIDSPLRTIWANSNVVELSINISSLIVLIAFIYFYLKRKSSYSILLY